MRQSQCRVKQGMVGAGALPRSLQRAPRPYQACPMYSPMSRLLKTVSGTSGPYLFYRGLFAFLVSKELWVFEEQGHITLGWIISRTVEYKIDAGLYKDYQERVAFFKELIQEDLKEAVVFLDKACALQSQSFSALKESLPTTLKESMQMQLEATYGKNVRALSNEIKRCVDYLEETKARSERDQLLKLINDSVEKQGSQEDFQKKFLQNVIEQLKSVAV